MRNIARLHIAFIKCYIPHLDNLDEPLDQMLNSSASLSPVQSVGRNEEDDDDGLVDHNDDEEGDIFISGDRNETVGMKAFEDHHTDEDKSLDNTVVDEILGELVKTSNSEKRCLTFACPRRSCPQHFRRVPGYRH
jgi:hypothetical protein